MSTSPGLVGVDEKQALLKSMSPDQLRQYAMAHRDDVIAMSLVSAVQSQRNKAQQAAQAAQASQGQQGKVVDQLAQSIPAESAGLPTLPARNMAMADGGIVGYAGGTLVQDEVPMFGGSAMQGVSSAPSSGTPDTSQNSPFEDMLAYIGPKAKEIARALARAGRPVTPEVVQQIAATTKEAPALGIPEMSSVRAMDRAQAGPTAAPSTGPTANAGAPPAGIPSALPPGTGGSVSQSFRRSGPTGGAPAGGIASTWASAKQLSGMGTDVDPAAAERATILANRQAQAQREQEDAEKRAAGLGSLLQPREERIARREAALEKQTDVDKNMAIINAGLSMMQSTGRGLAGIAEGATTGMKQYGEAMKLSKAERQKIDDARDAYDELKYNASNLSQKEITAAKNKLDEAANISAESGIAAAAKRAEGNTKVGEAIFNKTVDQQIAAEHDKRMLEAARITAESRIGRAGGPDRERLAELKSLQTNLQAQIKGMMPYGPDKANRAKLQAQLENVNNEVAQMARVGTMEPSPGAPSPGAPTKGWGKAQVITPP